MNRYRICAVQVKTGQNPEKNRHYAFDLCRKAASMQPDFIVLPEMFEIVAPPKKAAQHASPFPSARTDELGRLAHELSINIIGGTL